MFYQTQHIFNGALLTEIGQILCTILLIFTQSFVPNIEKIFQNLYILPFVTIHRLASPSSPQTLAISYLNMNENDMLNCIKCIILNYIKSIINSF